MLLDTEIVLSGDLAIEFHNQMMSADMVAIESRDAFLTNVHRHLDERGVMTIDIGDLEIDLK